MSDHPPPSEMSVAEHEKSPEWRYMHQCVALWIALNPQDGMRRMAECMELMAYCLHVELDGPKAVAAGYEASAQRIKMQQPQGNA